MKRNKKPVAAPDDYDSEVEDFLAYVKRHMDERKTRPGLPGDSQNQIDPAVPSAPVDPGAATGAYFGRPANSDVLSLLIKMVHDAVKVEDHIDNLRTVSNWLEEEADRLSARNPVDFHMSLTLH